MERRQPACKISEKSNKPCIDMIVRELREIKEK